VIETKAELREIEQKWFDISTNKVNKNRPVRTELQRQQQLAEYRLNNKDYYKTYRDSVAAKWGEHVACPCGGKYTRINKNAHLKRQKHCVFIATQTNLVD
jgi:hypothetical protein